MKPHRHAELIKAWADGAEIQIKMFPNEQGDWEWEDVLAPLWYPNNEYRIKPEEVKLTRITGVIKLVPGYCKFAPPEPDEQPNIELIFDESTNQLLEANVLNASD